MKFTCKKQKIIGNAIIWAAMILSTALIIDDSSSEESMMIIIIHIVGWMSTQALLLEKKNQE